MRTRGFLIAVITIAAQLGLVALGGPASAARTSGWEVTIRNLNTGQPLTPPVLAVHRTPFTLFTPGEAASFELKEVAENGNLQPLVDALNAAKHVTDVAVGGAPLVPSSRTEATGFNDEMTLTVDAGHGGRFLSWASMLICTNDGITGSNGVELPKRPGDTVQVVTIDWDAGTEQNTEDFADIVPPCQGLMGVASDDAGTGASDPAIAEDGVIHPHDGIQGGNDLLPEVHGFAEPITEVTITALG